MRLIFATHNANKVKEVNAALPATIKAVSLNEINFTDDIAETETTLEGNALLKAKTIYTKTGESCFADDSGLLVDALNGAPGVYSARYAGEQKNDEANTQKLLQELKGQSNRKAHFKSVIALVHQDKTYLFEGVMNGRIATEKQGTNGFGYDPVFIPDGYSKTFAEMTLEEKNKISHRAIAVKKLLTFLADLPA